MVDTEGPQLTSQHGAYALHAGLAKLHAPTLILTATRPGNHTHAQTHKEYFLLFNGNKNSRTRLSITSYVYCVFSFVII
jgi:hypothetical protein